MIKMFNEARNVSVPILVVRTADTVSTERAIVAASKSEDGKQLPVVGWDAVRGFHGANDAGDEQLKGKIAGLIKSGSTDFPFAMSAVTQFGQGTVVCVHHAQRQLLSSEPLATAAAVQAVANLRDELKRNFRMLVLLGPHFPVPAEIDQDIVVLEHALPGIDELKQTVDEVHVSANLPKPAADVREKAADALMGLSLFAAEQQTAMSLTPEGLDMSLLWERKRVVIEQTRGLRVWRGGERFDDLVGLESVKSRLLRRLEARTKVGVVVFMDEIDKVLANVEHDTSGVRMDQLRTLLTEMENNRWHGMVLVGVPGAGKSAIAKAFGNEAGVPTIALDLADMEGSLVGESEARVRHAISVIKAVGAGNAFFIATSNAASVMRPELQRRFTKGIFFCDVMTDAQRKAAWNLYMRKYEVKAQALPDDSGWTGAEIRNCVEEAWDTGCTLMEASRYIVSMAQGRAPEIEALRKYAHGRFLDANKPGPFEYTEEPMEQVSRAIKFPAGMAGLATMKES